MHVEKSYWLLAALSVACVASGGVVDSDGFEWFDGAMPNTPSDDMTSAVPEIFARYMPGGMMLLVK